MNERKVGVYWYLFSNHCTRKCIHKEEEEEEEGEEEEEDGLMEDSEPNHTTLG